ncbi:MAG: signal peptidase signal peptidase [Candidatus Paceibacter sp.]|jgi:signal peptidase I|nr:signal peptidase signal peptidase [Candidatus Paceibacter sp.]
MEPYQSPHSSFNHSNHSTPPLKTPPTPDKKENFFAEIVKFTFIALLIVLPIRLFIAQPFIVSGASMDPTFDTGEYLIVDQLSYQVSEPQRGQVVVFKYPKDETKFFIKRIIGLPGETVILDGTTVIIKNKENPDGFRLNEPYISLNNEKDDNVTITLKADQFFVLGDNRRQSFDSRSWGVLPRNMIIGKAFIRLFPIDKISILPGDYKEAK